MAACWNFRPFGAPSLNGVIRVQTNDRLMLALAPRDTPSGEFDMARIKNLADKVCRALRMNSPGRPLWVARFRLQELDMVDFERSDEFTAAEKAAYRFARDAGPLPSRTTAAHIEELRRHYADREIQEILSLIVTAGWLSSAMQSQLTVTDRLSMVWAQRNLAPVGWKPGPHFGLPNEQRRWYMTEVVDFGIAALNSGNVIDGSAEWLDADVPLGVDADGDGVSDGFDGFPDDPTRWEDTDRDGVEDAADDDIDGDGIANAQEVAGGTFPYKADSDGDGVIDPVEINAGTDPLDPRSL